MLRVRSLHGTTEFGGIVMELPTKGKYANGFGAAEFYPMRRLAFLGASCVYLNRGFADASADFTARPTIQHTKILIAERIESYLKTRKHTRSFALCI